MEGGSEFASATAGGIGASQPTSRKMPPAACGNHDQRKHAGRYVIAIDNRGAGITDGERRSEVSVCHRMKARPACRAAPPPSKPLPARRTAQCRRYRSALLCVRKLIFRNEICAGCCLHIQLSDKPVIESPSVIGATHRRATDRPYSRVRQVLVDCFFPYNNFG